jgi:steroid 5-alpha reductase family enzyme
MAESPATTGHRSKAFAICILAYLIALAVAFFVGYTFGKHHPIFIAFCADIAATLVIFIFSCIFRNSSFYDAYWSVAPLAIALYWTFGTASISGMTVRQLIVLLLVFAWGLRLTANWFSQWQGLIHEDWRYTDLRKRYRGRYWLIDLVGIEMMPTVIVFLGCLSLYPALSTGNNPFGWLDIVAIIITAGAIVIEATADIQLRNFIQKGPQTGDIMARGLWAYSRHPNYFGEVTFWWGLFIFALAAAPAYLWTIIGPMAITVLFFTVSIPLIEKRNMERRLGYDEHRKKVPVFIPRFPCK